MKPSQRLANAQREELARHARSPVGYESPGNIRMIDRIARSICTSTCAYRGVTPCWSVHTDREDAMEWPNPHCNSPGCSSIAADVYRDVTPGRNR